MCGRYGRRAIAIGHTYQSAAGRPCAPTRGLDFMSSRGAGPEALCQVAAPARVRKHQHESMS